MEWPALNSMAEIDAEALRVGPLRIAFLAPEDPCFMEAIRLATAKKLVEPVFIGRRQYMHKVAGEVGFDIGGYERNYLDDLQEIADRGLAMMYANEVDSVSKGQMSTNYVYRAIIRSEKANGGQKLIAVTSLWEIVPLNHLVILTDPGVSIEPDAKAKAEILRIAASLLRLLGHRRPRALALTAAREIDGRLPSRLDVEEIKACLKESGHDIIVESGSLSDLFAARPEDRPNILLVPHLVAGNSLVKLDFGLDVRRRAVVMTSRGPVLTPSRADTAEHLVEEISLVVAVAARFRQEGLR